jgi:hypothetical protein
VDIEEFYDADERRRRSAELELGRDWHDQYQVRYELNWVEDTGELYVMREPYAYESLDPFGGIHVAGTHGVDEAEVEGMTVSVVGTVADRQTLEQALEGWEEAMAAVDGPADPSSPLVT